MRGSGLAKVALGISLLAVALCATIWLSLLGAPLGALSGALGLVAVRRGRRAGQTTRLAVAAVVLSALAILSVPVLSVACSSLSCV